MPQRNGICVRRHIHSVQHHAQQTTSQLLSRTNTSSEGKWRRKREQKSERYMIQRDDCVCVWAEPFWYFLIVLFVGSIACFFAHELITGIIWIVIKLFDVVWWVRERALCAATIDEQRLVFTSLALSHTILPISRWILMILKLMSASDVCSRDSRHF